MFGAFIRALALSLALFPALAGAQSPISAFPPGAFQNRAALDPAPVAGAVCTNTDSATNNATGANWTASLNIGTAAANRLVIAGIAYRATASVSTFTINGVTMGQDVSNTSTNLAAVYSAVIASGSGAQTVVLNFSAGSFNVRSIVIWACTGLSSTTVKHTTTISGTSGTIAVDAGDFMVVAENSSAVFNLTGSTQAPSNIYSPQVQTNFADWNTITGTNASFTIANSLAVVMAAATYK